jgi:hypothetical protein
MSFLLLLFIRNIGTVSLIIWRSLWPNQIIDDRGCATQREYNILENIVLKGGHSVEAPIFEHLMKLPIFNCTLLDL